MADPDARFWLDPHVLQLYAPSFDGIEVNAVVYDAASTSWEWVPNDHPNPGMWSVYLHLRSGGVQCVADCLTRDAAMAVAATLSMYFEFPVTIK